MWIDAICIDQNNLVERAKQVRIMDKIYSNASNVIADLGEETPGSRVLFEELVEAEYAMAKGYSRPPPNNIIVRELEELLNRPWFRRVWVLQEVCVNSSVRFTCGSWSASCMALISCIFGYEKNTRVTKTICPLAILLSTHGQPEDVSTRRNLWNLLFQSRNCLATDPRDKTFALRSLIGHQRAEMDSLINYSQNFEDNFAAITLFLLPEIGPRLLVAARHPHGLNMPSWVPDWSQTLPIDYSIGTCAKYSPPLADTFLIQPPPQPRGGRWELRVKGMRYARVVQRSEVFSFKSIEDAEVQLKKVYHHLSNLRALFSQVYTRDDGSSYGQECPETESCMSVPKESAKDCTHHDSFGSLTRNRTVTWV